MVYWQDAPINLQNLQKIITAIGGLGTAAFGLLEASKSVIPWINNIGFGGIERMVLALTPGNPKNALSQARIIADVKANWINGTDLNSQKSIAKSLIKLNLSPANAPDLATATGVDSPSLTAVATSIAAGTALTSPQSDLYGRFDLIVTALLDETYQHSDNIYRNWTRALAAFIAVVLAVVGGLTINANIWQCLIVGLLASPLAPIAKDLSTALATAVNTMQSIKK
jgi:hypothetical protein